MGFPEGHPYATSPSPTPPPRKREMFSISQIYCDFSIYMCLHTCKLLFWGSRQPAFPGNKFTGGEPGFVRCRSKSETLISVWLRNFRSLTLLLMTAKDSVFPAIPETWLDSSHTQHPAVHRALGITSFTSSKNMPTWNIFGVVSWVGLSLRLVPRLKSDVPVSRYSVPPREGLPQKYWAYQRTFSSNSFQGPLLDTTYCGAALV